MTTDRSMVQHLMCIVPSAFCAMRSVNDEMYLPGNAVIGGGMLWKERKNNVKFYQTDSPPSATYVKSYRLLTSRALRSLKYSEELLVDYGNNY